jgi:hypothetical protein
MSENKQDEPKKEPEQKERDYYQKPVVPLNPEKSQSDTSGSGWSGERWAGRTWGGGRER